MRVKVSKAKPKAKKKASSSKRPSPTRRVVQRKSKRAIQSKQTITKSKRPTILKKSEDILSRKNNDGTFSLLNLENDSYFYTIDGVAAEFWALIDGKSTVETIKKTIVSKHNPFSKSFAAQFDRNVIKLIENLKKEKLLE